MRDSINYNLKYFIMRKSGTKPIKNTMRKQSPINMATTKTTKESPLKFFTHNAALTAARKVSDAISAKADKVKAQKAAKTETSTKTTTPKPTPAGKPASKTETSVKAPTMQLKKAGMKKKC